MKLPVPLFSNTKLYTEAEITKPSAGVLADAAKLADTGDYYQCLAGFVSGVITSLTSVDGGVITDRQQIRALTNRMPYRTAEFVSVQSILKTHDDDGIEGVYNCPRCNAQLICEAKVDHQTGGVVLDTRDFLTNQPVKMDEGLGAPEKFDLSEPVLVRNQSNGETLADVASLTIGHPTLADCTAAFAKVGSNDRLTLQFAIYIEALKQVNGSEVDAKWKNLYGMPVFRNASIADIKAIADYFASFGYKTTTLKKCRACSKEWEATLPTQGFFVSALRQG